MYSCVSIIPSSRQTIQDVASVRLTRFWSADRWSSRHCRVAGGGGDLHIPADLQFVHQAERHAMLGRLEPAAVDIDLVVFLGDCGAQREDRADGEQRVEVLLL